MRIVRIAIRAMTTGKKFWLAAVGAVLLMASPVSVKANNGVPDTGGRFPAVGAYYVFAKIGSQIDFVGENCTGSLIAPNLLMTAAHCTFYDTNRRLEFPGYQIEEWVTFDVFATDNDFNCFLRDIQYPGANDLICDASSRNFPTYLETTPGFSNVTHPGYARVGEKGNGELILKEPYLGNATDFGFVFLKNPVANITPLPLAPLGFLDNKQDLMGTPLVEVGYGMNETKLRPSEPTGTGGPTTTTGPTGIKQIAQVGTIQGIHNNSILPTQDSSHDGDVVCYGDSGSPLFLVENGTVVNAVLGVLSGWGNWCMGQHDPFSRVDVPEVMDFIDCVRGAANPGAACECGLEGALGLCG